MMDLTFSRLQLKCDERNEEWTGNQWDERDAVLEMVEEFGEYAGALKRVRRLSLGVRGDDKGRDLDQLKQAMMDEIGDMAVCLANMANSINVDLGECARQKFNKTSEKYGFNIFIE